jgi:hypothetical protein
MLAISYEQHNLALKGNMRDFYHMLSRGVLPEIIRAVRNDCIDFDWIVWL